MGVEGVTFEGVPTGIKSYFSSCGKLAAILIVLSKLPSHASSSMNCTSLLIMNFLVIGLYNFYAFDSSLYPTNMHFSPLLSNFLLNSSQLPQAIRQDRNSVANRYANCPPPSSFPSFSFITIFESNLTLNH
jgi:hypothetical protein